MKSVAEMSKIHEMSEIIEQDFDGRDADAMKHIVQQYAFLILNTSPYMKKPNAFEQATNQDIFEAAQLYAKVLLSAQKLVTYEQPKGTGQDRFKQPVWQASKKFADLHAQLDSGTFKMADVGELLSLCSQVLDASKQYTGKANGPRGKIIQHMKQDLSQLEAKADGVKNLFSQEPHMPIILGSTFELSEKKGELQVLEQAFQCITNKNQELLTLKREAVALVDQALPHVKATIEQISAQGTSEERSQLSQRKSLLYRDVKARLAGLIKDCSDFETIMNNIDEAYIKVARYGRDALQWHLTPLKANSSNRVEVKYATIGPYLIALQQVLEHHTPEEGSPLKELKESVDSYIDGCIEMKQLYLNHRTRVHGSFQEFGYFMYMKKFDQSASRAIESVPLPDNIEPSASITEEACKAFTEQSIGQLDRIIELTQDKDFAAYEQQVVAKVQGEVARANRVVARHEGQIKRDYLSGVSASGPAVVHPTGQAVGQRASQQPPPRSTI